MGGAVDREDRGSRIEDRSSLRSLFAKIICALNHPIEHCADMLPGVIKLTMPFPPDVIASQRMIQPCLGFHRLTQCFVHFIDKRRDIFPSRPCFGKHCVNSTRRASDLICQCVFFFARKGLRENKNLSGLFQTELVDVQNRACRRPNPENSLSQPYIYPFLDPRSSIFHPRSSILDLLSSRRGELRANLHRPFQFVGHFQNLQFEVAVEPVGA
jgi:hypothetical protein